MAKDTPKPVEVQEDFVVTPNVYSFSGGLEYVPMSIEAATLEEATKIWEKTRIPTGSPLQEKSDTI